VIDTETSEKVIVLNDTDGIPGFQEMYQYGRELEKAGYGVTEIHAAMNAFRTRGKRIKITEDTNGTK